MPTDFTAPLTRDEIFSRLGIDPEYDPQSTLTPLPQRTRKARQPNRTAMFLYPTSYENISQGKAFPIPPDSIRLVAASLCHIVYRNPTPADWLDTRPPHIKASDAPRADMGLFPIWDNAEDGPRTEYNFTLPPDVIARLALLSRAYIITCQPFRQATQNRIRITPTGYTRASPLVLAAYTLNAIGFLWLTPRDKPISATRQSLSPWLHLYSEERRHAHPGEYRNKD